VTGAAAVVVVGLSLCLDEEWAVDRLEPGGVFGGIAPVARAGGKAANVARVLMKLGVRARLLGAAGGDTGRRIRALLRAERIAADLVAARGESRRCILVVERERPRQTVLNGIAPPIPRRGIDELLRLARRALRSGASALVIAGSLPKDAAASAYPRFLALAREAGVPSLLDSSGLGLESGLSGPARPSIIKVNRREIAAFVSGGRVPRREPTLAGTIRMARWAREKTGVPEVVVTGGAREVVAVSASGATVLRPPKVPVRSAVGAGDAFAAGLVARPRAPLEERLALAIGAAADWCRGGSFSSSGS